jgi:Tfp pilus assembly protein PilP
MKRAGLKNRIREGDRGRAAMTYTYVLRTLSALLLVLPLLYGCDKKSAPVPARKAVPPPPVVKVEPETKPETKKDVKQFEYSRRGRRDPFRPLIEVVRDVEKEGPKTTGTLESYDISDFTVVAIARKGGQYSALLQSSDNKAFTVYEGMTLGLRKGKITEINKSNIITEEQYRDALGKTRTRQIILELHKGEE